jgi:c(7)-type cytochrome triheme protein
VGASTIMGATRGRLVGAGLALALAVGVASSRDTVAMPNAIRIPVVEPHPNGFPAAAALFRHSSHAQLSCYACHPGVFPRHRLGFTHQQMEGGRFCAACHEGHGAFEMAGAPCERCHVPQ